MLGLGPVEVLMIIVIVVVIVFGIPAFLRWLWNMTMPDVFDLRKITYWQSFRLMLISSILFGPALANLVG